MARLTPTRRRKMEEVYRWYSEEYMAWYQAHREDLAEFSAWKYAGKDPTRMWMYLAVPRRAIWPPRRQP